MKGVFKSYDIRGVYPDELDEGLAYRIGRALVTHLKAGSIAVGSDNRSSSPKLTDALLSGIIDAGADATLLGLTSTPMLYFASAKLGVDGAVMVTASHNPPHYNGFKVCRKNAIPIGLTSGLSDIRDLALAPEQPVIAKRRGSISRKDLGDDYAAHIASFARLNEKHFRVAVDAAHAMGALEVPILRGLSGVEITRELYATLQAPGTCPHEANPLKTETLAELGEAVRETNADFGVAYDGDADRIGFVDEHGAPVPMDFMTALIAEVVLKEHLGATVLYDLRSSQSVKEHIASHGGVARECMVGHANIKKQMLEAGAIFAGELTGHYYFALSGYAAEMGTLPALLIMNLMANTGKPLSQLVSGVRKYYHSGEINLHVKDTAGVFDVLERTYHDGTPSRLDGLKIVYPDWWFSIRASNTEPVVRLNIEGKTQALLDAKRAEILDVIPKD